LILIIGLWHEIFVYIVLWNDGLEVFGGGAVVEIVEACPALLLMQHLRQILILISLEMLGINNVHVWLGGRPRNLL